MIKLCFHKNTKTFTERDVAIAAHHFIITCTDCNRIIKEGYVDDFMVAHSSMDAVAAAMNQLGVSVEEMSSVFQKLANIDWMSSKERKKVASKLTNH